MRVVVAAVGLGIALVRVVVVVVLVTVGGVVGCVVVFLLVCCCWLLLLLVLLLLFILVNVSRLTSMPVAVDLLGCSVSCEP